MPDRGDSGCNTLDFPFFTLEYHKGCFKRLLPATAKDLGKGKFLHNGKTYQLPAGSDEALSKPALKGRALLSLLNRGQNPLIKKGPRLAHEDERLMELRAVTTGKDVSHNGSFSSRSLLVIELGFPNGDSWESLPLEWLPLEGLPRYRLYHDVIYEIIDDATLCELSENFGDGKGNPLEGLLFDRWHFVLKGDNIPRFVDNYGLHIFQFGDAKLKALLSEDSVFVSKNNISLILAKGKSDSGEKSAAHNGAITGDNNCAIPFLAIGEYRYPAEEVSFCMGREYIMLEKQGRWIRRQDLQTAGLFPLGCYAGGAVIEKVKLKNGEEPGLLPRPQLLAANLTKGETILFQEIISFQIEEKFSGIAGPSLYSELAMLTAEGPPAPFVQLRLLKGNLDVERMEPAERAFYVYWRTQARKGNVIKTGESYIRIYARELCLFSGGAGGQAVSHAENFRLLLQLWKNYRQEFPSLDNCIPAWLFDFIAVYEIANDALPLLMPHVYELNDPLLCDIYLYYHYVCENNSITYQDIKYLLPEKIDETQSLIVHLENAVNAVDRYLRENFHLGFFEFFFPPAYRTEKRTAFATMERAGRTSYIASAVRFSKHSPLLSFLEKLLHTDKDFSGSSAMLLPGLPHKTQFHDSRLQELRSDMDVVREKIGNRGQVLGNRERRTELVSRSGCQHDLITNNNPSPQSLAPSPYAVPSPNSPVPINNPSPQSLVPIPYILPRFLQTLNEMELRSLKIIALDPLFAHSEIEKIAKENGSMPELIIDRINAAFLELSGDLLIDTVDEVPTILGEYEAELKKHLE